MLINDIHQLSFIEYFHKCVHLILITKTKAAKIEIHEKHNLHTFKFLTDNDVNI